MVRECKSRIWFKVARFTERVNKWAWRKAGIPGVQYGFQEISPMIAMLSNLLGDLGGKPAGKP
jgi:hypothetical protein